MPLGRPVEPEAPIQRAEPVASQQPRPPAPAGPVERRVGAVHRPAGPPGDAAEHEQRQDEQADAGVVDDEQGGEHGGTGEQDGDQHGAATLRDVCLCVNVKTTSLPWTFGGEEALGRLAQEVVGRTVEFLQGLGQ